MTEQQIDRVEWLLRQRPGVGTSVSDLALCAGASREVVRLYLAHQEQLERVVFIARAGWMLVPVEALAVEE